MRFSSPSWKENTLPFTIYQIYYLNRGSLGSRVMTAEVSRSFSLVTLTVLKALTTKAASSYIDIAVGRTSQLART